MINDLTILIQGRCEIEQIKRWIENYIDINIILSTWDDVNLNLECPSNWIVIQSPYKDRYATKPYQTLGYSARKENNIIIVE